MRIQFYTRLIYVFTLFCLGIIMFATHLIHANDLGLYRWKNRIIITYTEKENHPELINLFIEMEKDACKMRDRDLLHFHFSDLQKLRKSLGFIYRPSANFLIILIGKDGDIKLESGKSSLNTLFELIDSMPMRQEEKKYDQC